MPQTLDLSLRPPQGEVFSAKQRFRVLVAGRRFGKSYLACIELFVAAINRPGETFFYCAPTYRMAKDIAWKTLKKIIPKEYIRSKNETDLRLELVNGSTIELKGTENAMALRGRSLAGVVLDEAAFMESEVWFEVIRPALADKQGWALFISTPDGTASWFYDLWCYCEEDKTGDWIRWCYTTIDGGNVPAHEVEAARAQLDARTFRQEFEASFENLTGLVAISFNDINISTEAEDISVLPPLRGGLQRRPNVRHLRRQKRRHPLRFRRNHDAWRRNHLGLRRRSHPPLRGGPSRFGLPRPNRRSPQNQRRRRHGPHNPAPQRFQRPITPLPWKIRDKITAVNTALLDATGTRRTYIHPRCKELIKSLRTLTYAPGTGLPNKNLGVDHAFDAFGYLVLQQFNLAKPEAMGTTSYRLY